MPSTAKLQLDSRHESTYFIPIAAPRKKGKDQLYFESEWTKDRTEPNASDNFLNLVLECTGQNKKDKEAKFTSAQTLWTPAVNNHGEFRRRAFLQIRDPWDAKSEIRTALPQKKV